MTTPTSYMPGAGPRPKRRFGGGALLGALAAGVLLGGGGGYASAIALGDDAPVETAAIEPAAQAAATSAPASSAAAAPAADDRRFALGKVWTFDNGSATTVVLRYKADISEPFEGERYHGIEVRTCIAKTADQAASISSVVWSLADADGGNYDLHVNGAVSGEYPAAGKTVEPGRCVKGWVVISAPKAAKPTLAVYEGAGNAGRPAEWALG